MWQTLKSNLSGIYFLQQGNTSSEFYSYYKWLHKEGTKYSNTWAYGE